MLISSNKIVEKNVQIYFFLWLLTDNWVTKRVTLENVTSIDVCPYTLINAHIYLQFINLTNLCQHRERNHVTTNNKWWHKTIDSAKPAGLC